MLVWMFQEALTINIDKKGRLILNDMVVQDDLKMSVSNRSNLVDWLVEKGTFPPRYEHALHQKMMKSSLPLMNLSLCFYHNDEFMFPFA